MKNILNVGDILVGEWHYTMTYPVWFKVTKVTDKQARAVRLRSVMVRSTDGGYNQQGYEAPAMEQRVGERGDHVIRMTEYGLATGSKYDYFHLEKWDGKPRWADHCD